VVVSSDVRAGSGHHRLFSRRPVRFRVASKKASGSVERLAIAFALNATTIKRPLIFKPEWRWRWSTIAESRVLTANRQ